MSELQGKVALITGAARGQGRAEAVKLAENGADILGIDVVDKLRWTIAEPSTEADLAETARLVEETGRRFAAVKASSKGPVPVSGGPSWRTASSRQGWTRADSIRRPTPNAC